LSRLSSLVRLTLGFGLIAVSAVVWMIALLPLLPWRVLRIRACNLYGKLIGRSIVFIAGATPIIRHRELLDASMPAIYVPNHTSTLDAFLGIWLCPWSGCGVAKKEVRQVPFFGWLYVLSGHLLVDRSNTERAIASMNETAALMKKHQLGAWIWPEGTRSKDGRLLPLKKGFVHLAIAAGVPVVPVVVHGAHRNWPRGKFSFHPCAVEIDVLPAVDTSSWRAETADQHAQQIHDLMAAALKDEQKPRPVPTAVAA
jgi:1-acyl-sn-glycerol-3-phosphate acyltransferase